MKGLLGRKLGMTQVFTNDGTLIPVTVVEVTPNVVTQKKTLENDGYVALQLGMEDITERRATKANIGHAKKAGTAPKRFYRELKSDEMADLEVGATVTCDLFAEGDMVDVQGISRGKGYMGAVYRNNQALQPRSHGASLVRRAVGSLATIGRNNGYINKGRLMAGHEGTYTTTNQNLQIIKVDTANNVLLIKGNVPGPRKGLVIVKTTTKPVKHVAPVELVNYITEKEA
ncbi:MAG: 50S ribosomal protein L3 [Erysipelotrichaceae bacterium]|nr:50S ribosomal protein L3 [Erysipelotrichaceae bacterium]MBE6125598.1 50S ribosomal protein L3 [Erysipelotrichaceae bacterium]